jgi:hypothetical protein
MRRRANAGPLDHDRSEDRCQLLRCFFVDTHLYGSWYAGTPLRREICWRKRVRRFCRCGKNPWLTPFG